ncbi:hypothetical protein [Nostoc sp.]
MSFVICLELFSPNAPCPMPNAQCPTPNISTTLSTSAPCPIT